MRLDKTTALFAPPDPDLDKPVASLLGVALADPRAEDDPEVTTQLGGGALQQDVGFLDVRLRPHGCPKVARLAQRLGRFGGFADGEKAPSLTGEGERPLYYVAECLPG